MEKVTKRKNIIRYLLIGTLGLIVFLLLAMFLIPSIFNDFISQELKKGINEQLKTELKFKESDISFFKHFPALTFSFQEVQLAGSEPFSNEPLLTAKELGFGLKIFKLLFSKEIEIDETYLTDCSIILKKDRSGNNNYDVYHRVDSVATENDSTALGLNLNLDKLKIKNANVLYQDESSGITIIANKLDYRGKGGIDEGVLQLGSRLEIESIDVVFDNVEYLKGKKLRAKSFTIFDTKNLSIKLDDNTISLNSLNVNFNGTLDVFKDGLAYDFIVKTKDGTIENVISALPPSFTEWSKKIDLKGDMAATVSLKGYSGVVPDTLKTDRTQVEVDISNGRIANKETTDAIENLFVKFKGSREDGMLDFNLENIKFKFKNEETTGKLILRGKEDSLYIKSNILTDIDLTSLNRTLQLPGYEFNGIVASNWFTEGVYQPSASKFPKTNGSFKLTNGSILTPGHPEPIKNIDLDAVVQNQGNSYSESSLRINELSFSFLENNFTAKAFFKNFDYPEYQIKSVGTIDFTTLHQVIDLPFLISNGSLTANMSLQGQVSNPENEASKNNVPTLSSGTLDIKNIEIKTDLLQYPMLVSEGKFMFLNEKMAISKLTIQHGSSNLLMNGFFKNYLDYALLSKGVLRGDIKLKSSYIDVTEFFPKEGSQANQSKSKKDNTVTAKPVNEAVTGVMLVPNDLDMVFQVEVDTLQYNSLFITSLTGVLGIQNEGLFLKNSDLRMVDGAAHVEGIYRPINSQKAFFSMELKATHLDIEKGYQTIELFKELVPAAAKASGRVSVDYKISGTLDNKMLPVLPSLEGNGTLTAEDVQFEGYKLLGKLSKESGFEALNDAAVSKIAINSSIDNNVLNLEQFKFKVRPFHLKTEGQTTLDGKLNLKIRIGLPPFGIIGIPVVITGSGDDMHFKLGKKAPDLKELADDEKGYSDQEIARMKMLKDSIREGMTLDEIDKMQRNIENINLDSLKTKKVDTLRTQ
ncbi:AsmA-like C-terminal region-containing protein [Aequorivita todarodis]|uniref:AsmA-like C-terminal region-containing protein n=1 Tax=Aequorivita todarodis TaxID=2036821 RepID=UPI002350D029|nr:AsmA-like C-terminal region-containing protein [Aequorivita todarodis]MDC7999848.1 AsmA-like C-terminal region-containing protein [Aequorivita todarodis]